MLFYSPGVTFVLFFMQSILFGAIAWVLTGDILFTGLAFGSGIALFVAWVLGSWISGKVDDKAYERETVNSDAKLAKYSLSLEETKAGAEEENLFGTKLEIRDWLMSNEGATTEQLLELFPVKDFTGDDYEDILTTIGAYGVCRFGQDSNGFWFTMRNEEVASRVHRLQRENQKKPQLVTA